MGKLGDFLTGIQVLEEIDFYVSGDTIKQLNYGSIDGSEFKYEKMFTSQAIQLDSFKMKPSGKVILELPDPANGPAIDPAL